MSWSISDLFTGGAADLVGGIGEAIDKNVTSDEERLEIDRLVKAKFVELKEKVLEFHTVELEQVSKRHENDMKSDSWLSKNIRPLALVCNTLFVMLFAMVSYCTADKGDIGVLTVWVGLFTALLLLQYGFYYGSRGLEKVTTIIGAAFGNKGIK